MKARKPMPDGIVLHHCRCCDFRWTHKYYRSRCTNCGVTENSRRDNLIRKVRVKTDPNGRIRCHLARPVQENSV